jgi:hypothetical protein
MFKKTSYFIFIIFVFLSCEKGEDDAFTFEVDESVTSEDIKGTWKVFAGEYKDELVQLPMRFPECGNDFIVFDDGGVYKEVLFDHYNCIPQKESANWEIENGIITISNSKGEQEKLPIIEFSPSELVVNFLYDIDYDGKKDVFKAYLRPYDPIPNNHIAKSFQQDGNETTLLKFNWKRETDYSSFKSYEIFRSEVGECSKENAILLAEIKDISETTFVDYSPPTTQNDLCYFLRIYSKDGLVGESELLTVKPSELTIPNSFKLNNVSIDGEKILLEWDEHEIPYFSHYEIVYANSDGTNRLFHEEGSLLSIDDFKENTYLITDTPYLENPYLAIYAYNIFGFGVVSNYEQVTFKRKDLVGPIYLKHIEIDDDETAVYLYGSSQIPDWATYDVNAVLRFNYHSGVIESTTSEEIYVSGEFPFRKPINFPEGRSLVVNGRTNFHFYNATSLTKSFSFSSFYLNDNFGLFGVVDFTYTKNGFFIVIDTNSIYVFKRSGNGLILLNKQKHYQTHHGDNFYRIIEVNDNEILIGHKNDAESILFKVDNNGLLRNKRIVSFSLKSDFSAKYKNTSFYSDSSNSLINYGQRTLYSTLNFESVVQMPEEHFALGLSKDAKYIFATTNNPDWLGSDLKTKLLKREVLFFDTVTNEMLSIKTKGYPIQVFENKLGKIFSISIPKNQPEFKFEIFVEEIELP